MAASSSSARPSRRPTTTTATIMATELAGLSWNPISDFEQLTEFPFMVNALRGGDDRRRDGRRDRLVHGPAPTDLRRPHPLGDRLPGRGGGDPGRAAARARLLRRLRPRGAGARRGQPAPAGRHAAASRRRSARCRRSASASASSSSTSTAASSPASSRCSSAPSSASPPAQVADAAVDRPRRPPRCSRRSGGHCSSPRSTPRSPAPPECRRGQLAVVFLLLLGLAVAATAADHRRPAGLRPARHPGRHRAADHGPAGSGAGALGGARAGGHLGRADDRLLLALSGRLLGHEPLVRPLRRRSGCAGPRVAAATRSSRRWASRPDVRPRVHAQRLPRRHLRRAGLRAGRLLRRPAQPGLRRRRAQPRRLHRSPRGGGGRDRRPARPLRRDDRRRGGDGVRSASAPAPTTS